MNAYVYSYIPLLGVYNLPNIHIKILVMFAGQWMSDCLEYKGSKRPVPRRELTFL